MNRTEHFIFSALLCSVTPFTYAQASTNSETAIEQITVEASATANKLPVGTFDSPVSNLEYDPRVDLQSRNMAEAQADVTIRGGIFENTGFRVGSATLLDPQTGHYVAELPIAPQMLTGPYILTGADNALNGMNSSVGSISFGFKPITTGGNVSVGTGTNNFNLHSIYAGISTEIDDAKNWQLGFEGEYSHSQSDGSIENGDHDFNRASARIQLIGADSQTDIMYGSQDKFFGWPNMYTPFGVNETEELETRLLMLNHQQNYADNSHFEVSAYYRKHNDHYVFSRENPSAFEAFHETKVKSIAVSGSHAQNTAFAVNYSAQYIEDEIESTTLENNFTSRTYYKLSVLPEYKIDLEQNQLLTLRLGAAFDDTNRDDSELSLIGDISLNTQNSDGSEQTLYVSYAQASQVAGYTAIGGSEQGGLFRSNYNLERETTKNIELGYLMQEQTWQLNSAVFYREDNNLTDWTFSFDSSSARFANPVDIDATGVEFFATKYFDTTELIASYTYLNKSENYGDADIDASFYALNFPDHRVTLGAIWTPNDLIEMRVDNEWRKQHENALRNGKDTALFTQLSLKITPTVINNLFITLAADNVWDESFEEIPGTPGRGEQYTLSATYSW
ncbi:MULTISPECIES: TonB-dependent receptor [unclassified Pseudoalteromonas]|uniref:TonB-dependent receptor plug domain-containing protein n=1 Tax=unclassified Pseudoalteromonas TaxID=194690 RepID=UPI0011083873|nr:MULTISPECIES: TonB-dependent receptor [unclassified Pseudoalteromonas]TMN82633.1 TonB-dependent receptor [Pseudoalteromonas sp. S410]TMN92790.1 TonB-dependent receptor [Pseudoalteromonas sp. S408]TMN95603.1 TonB-dependent receptor [Pseudoalteromonas sp. S409]TMO01114.1 TonB-dependent receptor [Pseudoalteromonas sp. S407]TMO06166.1 TonB-dependent receptor [Pseudoalteromonas sp. S186]